MLNETVDLCRDQAGMRHEAETKLDEIRELCEAATQVGSGLDPADVLWIIAHPARDGFPK
jgi:hypothetical protein